MIKNIFSLSVAMVMIASVHLAQALEVGDIAPCIPLSHIERDGSTQERCVDARENGSRYILLEFFLTTCSDCQDDLPTISNFVNELGNTTTVKMVGMDRPESIFREYMSANASYFNMTVAMDTTRRAIMTYRVDETPTLFILGDDNRVIFRHGGRLNPEDVQTIRELVSK